MLGNLGRNGRLTPDRGHDPSAKTGQPSGPQAWVMTRVMTRVMVRVMARVVFSHAAWLIFDLASIDRAEYGNKCRGRWAPFARAALSSCRYLPLF